VFESEIGRLDFVAVQPGPDFVHGVAERLSMLLDADAERGFERH
jgi:hypothetical protein